MSSASSVGAALLVGLVAIWLIAGCGPGRSREAVPDSPHLDAARRAGNWLVQLGRSGPIPDDLRPSATSSPYLDTGAAGRVVFLLELFAATRDESHLRLAEREGEAAVRQTEPGPHATAGAADLGLYNGVAGVAFALTELARRQPTGRPFPAGGRAALRPDRGAGSVGA